MLDKICVVIFLIDYGLRWLTADYQFAKHSVLSFVRYPFSLMAVVDLVSVLPSLTLLNRGFKQTGVEPNMPGNGYFTHLAMLSALPYAGMPAASSYAMHAKYPFPGSLKF